MKPWPEPIPPSHEIVELAAPRPAIDLTDTTPDLTPYGRWPLTVAEHPELDPHFAIADALAQPGISWQDLCARGARFRHMSQNAELGDYLAAWCSVAKQDYADALYRLGLVPRTPKLKHAIEMDVVAILAAGIPGNEAEGALRLASLIEVHVVDIAAASYFEIGKLEDAYALNRLAIDMDATPTEANRCSLMWLDEVAGLAKDLEKIPNPNFDRARTGVDTTSVRIQLEGDMRSFRLRLEAIASTAHRLHNTNYSHCIELIAALPPVSP
jgi:hypothetical protein